MKDTPPPRSGLGPRKVYLKAEDNGFWVLTSPSRMSPDISLFSATHDILAPQEHPPLPSPRAVLPASPCGQHGCLQCVSPSRAVCSASGLFLGGGRGEGTRPVVTPAVCTQMASFQNHVTDRMKTPHLDNSQWEQRNLQHGAEGQHAGCFEVVSGVF